MILKKIFFFILFTLFVNALIFSLGNAEVKIKILYSSTLNNNPDNSNYIYKLLNRNGLIKSIINQNDIILLDTGDLLKASLNASQTVKILKTYSKLGYNAIGAGELEFLNGFKKILEHKEYFPIISHNLSICPDANSCIFFSTTPLILENARHKIGVFALIDPFIYEFSEYIKIEPIESSLQRMLYVLNQEKTNINILIFHGTYENAVNINTQEIDIVIIGHEKKRINAEKISNTIFISSGNEGNGLGMLELYISDDGIKNYTNTFY